jgi:hypothetical protein
MLRPRAWQDSRLIRRLVRDYPVYSPPHEDCGSELSLAQGQVNYDYFLGTKAARLSSLHSFLASFDVKPTLDGEGLKSVDAWVHRYAGHLIDRHRTVSYFSFRTFYPAWVNEQAGLNILWDLGTYAGEMIIHLNSNCEWFFNGGKQRVSTPEDPAYFRPCLHIERPPGYHDLFSVSLIQIAQAKIVRVALQAACWAAVSVFCPL